MHPHLRPFLSSTGECKNKSDEDAIMRREIIMLRSILASPKLERSKLKEYLIRLMYVEMLGHDASFGYIHAVKATHEPDLALKRVGYLATSAFLHENHDLIILIVNTVQQDLKDDNYLVVCAALTTVCRLVNEETIPAVLPQVTELLSHPKEHVRKKAVMALHRFHQRSPASVAHLQSKFRQMLCDKDPSVMAAALCALHDLIAVDPTPHKNLIPSFVSILKQIVEHRLPKSYDYHRVPAPFVQIKLLKILAALGTADKTASSEMYSVLSSTLKKADNQANVGNAIVYECVRTAATIYPSPVLLEHCASVVSRFVKSPKNNLRYVGLDSLSRVVNINPKYAVEHQMAVVDCLTDPDESLRKKTLDLLYRMTKSHNVEVIVEKMTEFLRSASDRHTREETVHRIGELAERYAPTTRWFIETMNTIFAIGGDVVKPVTAHNLMRLIGEGSGDDAADAALRASAVASYLDILDANPKIPEVLLEVIVWVVGEFGTLSGKSAAELMDALCAAVDAQSAGDAVRAQAMTACAKLAAAGAGALRRRRETDGTVREQSRRRQATTRARDFRATRGEPRDGRGGASSRRERGGTGGGSRLAVVGRVRGEGAGQRRVGVSAAVGAIHGSARGGRTRRGERKPQVRCVRRADGGGRGVRSARAAAADDGGAGGGVWRESEQEGGELGTGIRPRRRTRGGGRGAHGDAWGGIHAEHGDDDPRGARRSRAPRRRVVQRRRIGAARGCSGARGRSGAEADADAGKSDGSSHGSGCSGNELDASSCVCFFCRTRRRSSGRSGCPERGGRAAGVRRHGRSPGGSDDSAGRDAADGVLGADDGDGGSATSDECGWRGHAWRCSATVGFRADGGHGLVRVVHHPGASAGPNASEEERPFRRSPRMRVRRRARTQRRVKRRLLLSLLQAHIS